MKRILSAKRIKKAVQLKIKAAELWESLDNKLYDDGMTCKEEQVPNKTLEKLAEIFNLNIIRENKLQTKHDDGVIYIEGFRFYAWNYFKQEPSIEHLNRNLIEK